MNSIRATQFRQWATGILRVFTLRGYVIDRARMESGEVLGRDYFEELLKGGRAQKTVLRKTLGFCIHNTVGVLFLGLMPKLPVN